MASLYEAMFALATALVGWLGHWVLYKQRKWARARQLATEDLASTHPDSSNDPEEAMERAVLSVNRDHIQREARRLKRTRPPSGSLGDRNGDGHKTPAHGVAIARTTSDDREP